MKKLILLILLLSLAAVYTTLKSTIIPVPEPVDIRMLYTEMKLGGIVNYTAFEQAMIGFNSLSLKKRNVVTLIDFSKPSVQERLYVLDLRLKKILFSSHVAHGQNSGENYATSFSNQSGSHKSSLGFFVTEDTYQGRNGYSLVLDGLEEGINDKAKSRAIVIHAAPYTNPSVAASMGRLGRSWGCPALPPAKNDSIINTIKGGSLIYIYADDKDYSSRSPVLCGAEYSKPAKF